MSHKLLSKVADVLEAVAEENEKQAAELAKMQKQEFATKIAPVVSKLATVTGESKADLESKLASANSDILDVIAKLAGDSEVTQFGSPKSEKTASVNSSRNPDRAFEAFGNWITGR
jgi:hypothetical protein